MTLNQPEKALIDDYLKILDLEQKIKVQEQALEQLKTPLLHYDRYTKEGITPADMLARLEQKEPETDAQRYSIMKEKTFLKALIRSGSQEDLSRRIIQEMRLLAKYKKILRELEARVEKALER